MVPKDSEWETLFKFLGGRAVAGDKLKETGNEHWSIYTVGAINESGVSAIPAGMREGNSFSESIRQQCYYWSANQAYPWIVPVQHIHYLKPEVSPSSFNYGKDAGLSVRCVKDE